MATAVASPTKIIVQNRENFNQLKKKFYTIAQKHPIASSKDKSNKFMIEFDVLAENIFSKIQSNILVEGKEYEAKASEEKIIREEYEDREEELDKELTERVKSYEQKLKILSDRIKKKREAVTAKACKVVDTKLTNDAPQLATHHCSSVESTAMDIVNTDNNENLYTQFEKQQLHNANTLNFLEQTLPDINKRAQNLLQISSNLNLPVSQTEPVIIQDFALFSTIYNEDTTW